MLTDTHCHLYYEELFKDLGGVLDRAREQGVNRFICVGTNIQDSKKSLSITENHDSIFASAGVHPHDAKDVSESFIDDIYKLMENDSMVAIGEIGLDYFRNISKPEIQKEIFVNQMKISKKSEYAKNDYCYS